MTKYIIEVKYGFDGSDVTPDIIKETLQDAIDATVTIETLEHEEVTKHEQLSLNTMLFVDGSKQSYRHDCGSNVFSKWRKPDGEIYYQCHGCLAIVTGEPND